MLVFTLVLPELPVLLRGVFPETLLLVPEFDRLLPLTAPFVRGAVLLVPELSCTEPDRDRFLVLISLPVVLVV